MNVVTSLLLICALIILAPLALAMLLVSGVAVVTAARDWRTTRQIDRDITDLLRERS